MNLQNCFKPTLNQKDFMLCLQKNVEMFDVEGEKTTNKMKLQKLENFKKEINNEKGRIQEELESGNEKMYRTLLNVCNGKEYGTTKSPSFYGACFELCGKKYTTHLSTSYGDAITQYVLFKDESGNEINLKNI